MSVVFQVGATHLKANATAANNGCNGVGDGTSDPDLKDWNPGDLSGFQDVKATIVKSSLPYQFVLQDHNYGAPPPPSPPPPPTPHNNSVALSGSTRLGKSSPILSPVVTPTTNHKVNGVTTAIKQESTKVSELTLNNGGSGADEQCGKEVVVTSVTRCICEFAHDDEYMICCDKCSVWQHVDCMGLDRSNIPETYLCERCQPRKVDKQKAKALQTKKRGQMNDSSSEESNTEGGRSQRNNHCDAHHNGPVHRRFGRVHGRARRIGRRRKSSSVSCTSAENGTCGMASTTVANNSLSKRRGSIKEKPERKRVCVRRKRSKSTTGFTHVNEETQDVVLRKWIDQYEEAVTNQYSPELLLRLSELKLNGQCEETSSLLTSLQMVQRCKVTQIDEHTKGLVATERLVPNQEICEYRGQFYLGSEFHQKYPLQTLCPPPFVLWHHFDTGGGGDLSVGSGGGGDVQKDKNWICQDSYVCVDAREYGNEARFVRRSCNPNAEVRHLAEKGMPRVYLMARSDISVDEEITVPFDFDIKSCVGHVKCVCTSENCLVMSTSLKNGLCDVSLEKKRRVRKITCNSTDGDEGSQSSIGGKKSMLCEAPSCENVSASQLISPGSATQVSSDDSQLADAGSKEDDGCGSVVSPAAVDRRKMTREERKMEAIVRAFERMEKAEQRRQEAQARQQQKKVEQKRKSEEEQVQNSEAYPDGTSDLQGNEPAADPNTGQSIKSENNLTVVDEEVASSAANTQPNLVPTACFRHKLKGRRRKTSGAPSRRSSRVNSGGSDVLLLSQDENSQHLPLCPISAGVNICSSTIATPTLSQQQGGCLASPELVSTLCSTAVVAFPSDGDIPSPTALSSRPKTKKHLMNEWLHESSEPTRGEGGVEIVYNRRCRSPSLVVSCSSSALTISSNHLRKSLSGDSGTKQPTLNGTMGSAKKRWLRQAMTEDLPDESSSQVPNSAGSRPGTPLTSPVNADVIQRTLPAPDLVTPLKKRRLARESDVAAPQSPMSNDAGDGSASCDSDKAIPLLRKFQQQQSKSDDVEVTLQPQSSYIGRASSSLNCVFPSWMADTSDECAPCRSEDYAVSSSCANNDYDDCDDASAEDLRVPDGARARNASPIKTGKKFLMVECTSSTVEDTVTSSYVSSEPEAMDVVLEENHRTSFVEDREEDVEMGSVQDVAVDLSFVMPPPVPCDPAIVKSEIVVEAEDACSSSEMKTVVAESTNDLTYDLKCEEGEARTSEVTDVVALDKVSTKSEVKSEDLLVTVFTTPPPPPPPTPPPLVNLGELVVTTNSALSHAPAALSTSFEENHLKDGAIPSDGLVSSPATSASSSSTPLSSPRSTVTSPTTPQNPVTPAKRKVSLLEYRQRKMESTSSSSSSSSSSCSSNNNSISPTGSAASTKRISLLEASPTTPAVSTSITQPSATDCTTVVSSEVSPVTRTTSPSSKVSSSDGDIKWDSTATSVERQRENLTQRLKREFGLMMEDENHTPEANRMNSSEVPSLHSRPLYSVPICAPVGSPMMVIGSNIPTIVGVRNYGSIRAAAVPGAATTPNAAYPPTVYGTYPMSAVAPPHSLTVVTATPPPPPPPVQPPPHLRTCLVQLGEVPTQAVTPLTAGAAATIIPHPFPLQGFPQIPLQLPPPPPPPLPPPPPPIQLQQHAISTVPVSVQQIPLPKPQSGGGLPPPPPPPPTSNSDSHSKDGK